MIRFPLLFLLLILVDNPLSAQFNQVRYGKISDEEINYTDCAFEKEVDAVILKDVGKMTIVRGRSIEVERIQRVKILHSAGVSHANISIPFYSHEKLQRVVNLKAQTINLVNGKKEITPVKKDAIFTQQVSDKWSDVRFTFPKVKEGSILEYQYMLVSDLFTAPFSYEFQNNIPTLYSSFTALIGEGLNYQFQMQGPRLVAKYQQTKPTNTWTLENVPSLRPDPFVDNVEKYLEKVSFQLESYTRFQSGYGGSGTSEVMVLNTWENFVKDEYINSSLDKYLGRQARVNELVAKIPSHANPTEQIMAVRDFMVKTYEWNGKYRFLPEKKFAELQADARGSSADLNLLMVRLLREKGLRAFPAIGTIRSRGRITKSYPFIEQYHQVLAYVDFGDDGILLDATQPALGMGLLGQPNLIEEYFLFDKSEYRWITVKEKEESTLLVSGDWNLSENEISITLRLTGYPAQEYREWLLKPHTHDQIERLQIPSLKLEETQVKGLENPNIPLEITCKYSLLTDHSKAWFLQGSISRPFSSNPFVSEERKFPVDLPYAYKYQVILKITFPESYRLEQPEAPHLARIGNKAEFVHQVQSLQPNQVQYMSKLHLKAHNFDYLEYYKLRELFGLALKSWDTPIVLEKAR
jgi:hypothetical protein